MFEDGWIEVELGSQAGVENDQPWILCRRRRDPRVEPRRECGISVLETELHDGRQCISLGALSARARAR